MRNDFIFSVHSLKTPFMKIRILLFILISIAKFSDAQDTIVKTNGDVIQAKIIEINPSQVKYKKYSFQDGPTYIESKSDIRYVKYSNGLKEEFSSTPVSTGPIVIQNQPQTTGSSSNTDYYDPNAGRSVSNGSKMIPVGTRYKYMGRKIGEREMQGILLKTNDKDIVRNIQAAKDAHKFQYIGFAAFPLAIAGLVVMTNGIDSYGNMDSGSAIGGLLLVGAAITCPVLSGVFKHKRTTSNREAVELYNQKY